MFSLQFSDIVSRLSQQSDSYSFNYYDSGWNDQWSFSFAGNHCLYLNITIIFFLSFNFQFCYLAKTYLPPSFQISHPAVTMAQTVASPSPSPSNPATPMSATSPVKQSTPRIRNPMDSTRTPLMIDERLPPGELFVINNKT